MSAFRIPFGLCQLDNFRNSSERIPEATALNDVRHFLVISLCLLLALTPLGAQTNGAPVTLQIQVLEGDGTTYPTGSRATRGVTVLISDETGKPVTGATVNFTLPEGGPGGSFAGGGRSQMIMTQGDGKAGVWGMQWNRTPGPFEIRVTAAKGQARAGTVINSLLSAAAAPQKAARAVRSPSLGSGHKWLWIGVALGGAAAAGAVGFAARPANAASSPAVTIGTPTVTLGHP